MRNSNRLSDEELKDFCPASEQSVEARERSDAEVTKILEAARVQSFSSRLSINFHYSPLCRIEAALNGLGANTLPESFRSQGEYFAFERALKKAFTTLRETENDIGSFCASWKVSWRDYVAKIPYQSYLNSQVVKQVFPDVYARAGREGIAFEGPEMGFCAFPPIPGSEVKEAKFASAERKGNENSDYEEEDPDDYAGGGCRKGKSCEFYERYQEREKLDVFLEGGRRAARYVFRRAIPFDPFDEDGDPLPFLQQPIEFRMVSETRYVDVTLPPCETISRNVAAGLVSELQSPGGAHVHLMTPAEKCSLVQLFDALGLRSEAFRPQDPSGIYL